MFSYRCIKGLSQARYVRDYLLLPVVPSVLEVVHCVPQRGGVGVIRLVHLSILGPHFLRQVDKISAGRERGRRRAEQC